MSMLGFNADIQPIPALAKSSFQALSTDSKIKITS